MRFLLTLAALLGMTAATAPAADAGPFRHRGYYITLMRMPTYDLPAWKRAVEGVQADGGNLLILWVASAFRSRRFPVTWRYNAEHANIKHDFVGQLIDHAHVHGIKVLLGFTPFGYDGVNQYPLEHPELRAVGKDGRPVGKFGIDCWGYNLCPARAESQGFLRDYVREMLFDFYPNADGLFIESSDYAVCHCPECGPHFFDHEFRFVEQISRDVWARKPKAMIVVYPHYFSSKPVPGLGVSGARHQLDRRWTLFFTPHSAYLDPDLIRRAGDALYWDDAVALGTPERIRDGARRARQAGVGGYVPSLEAYSYVVTEPEEGQRYLVGKRQVPLGFAWLQPGQMPYDELPMRVNRIAYRAFSRDPDLPFDEFKRRLGREVFGAGATPRQVDDLLELQAVFARERSWCQVSPLVCPERVRALKQQGQLSPVRAAEYRAALDRLRGVERRSRAGTAPTAEVHRIARWVLDLWTGENAALLGQQIGGR